MKALDQKTTNLFEGKVVRKDLTKLLKSNAVVPSYVLEYLLSQHCATNDNEVIAAGIEKIKSIIANHFVHRDEAEAIKSLIRERESYRIIDKIGVKLNDRANRYEARFTNLGLNKIPISDDIVRANKKMLSEGVWSLINIAYLHSDESGDAPWIIESVKPIQISNVDINEYKALRKEFTLDEWLDLLMQSIGLHPEEFSQRSKLIQLSRLIPFTENNYNLIELGPKGTGKSHIYSEMSPHGILLSGGEVSKAKLFVNNSNEKIGLVGYWDVIAYDEFAGADKRVDKSLVDIMKNYMANKYFSRGTDVYQAEASMAFVGNTDRSVKNMVTYNDLFIALPKGYYDTAFLDRIHLYLPGWEVSKLRNELFTNDFGFVVDYLAEILKHLRKEDYSKAYQKYFTLSDTITTRDKTGIEKTFSGLLKIVFPDGNFTEEECRLILEFAIEGRKRVKLQLQKMDETFNDEKVLFEYRNNAGKTIKVNTLEEIEFDPVPTENGGFGMNSDSLGEDGVRKIELADVGSQTAPEVELKPFNKAIRDNQTQVTYDRLFGAYLKGVTHITIQDPYIRMPYQFRNLLELCSLIYQKNIETNYLKIHVITANEAEYYGQSEDALSEIQLSLEELNIDFTFELDDTIHDRFIKLDNGWQIMLGRGLDIWQKSPGRYNISDVLQEKRKCKAFNVVAVKEERLINVS